MAVELNPVAPAAAIAALQARGRTFDPTFAWQERYAEDHGAAFTVAKSAGFEILNDIYAALEGALVDGSTSQDFAARVTPILQDKGWWGRKPAINPATGLPELAQLGSPRRLQLIFDVNMRVSYAAGHWDNFERNKKARPFLRYVHLEGQENPRLQHQAWHNICLPVEHPFWQTHACPNGWNCHCTLQSLSQRDVDRLQRDGVPLRFEPPEIRTSPWVNKVTGETRNIPEGIDPGWDHNPGQVGYRSGLVAAEKLVQAPPALAALVNDDPEWITRPLGAEFARWCDLAAAGGRVDQSTVVVGALDRVVLEALAERGSLPQSGAITLQQQAVQHMIRWTKQARGAAVDVDLLRNLPELLSSPRAVLIDRRNGDLLYVFDVEGAGDTAGKLVVQLDRSQKVKPSEGARVVVTTNSIRSAGIVPLRSLANRGFYEVLKGSV